MSSITTGSAKQYADSTKLAARARLHQAYTINEGAPWFPWVAAQLGLREGASVLDIGCGPGWFWAASADVLPQRLQLTLADLSPGMVSEAAERCRPLRQWSAEGVQADVVALPFADASFDCVVAMHMLYHVADQEKAVAEMHRVLRPGGTLAVTTNGVGNMRELYELTTVFGSDPVDPAGAAFGFDKAEALLKARFGNVKQLPHPSSLRVTEAEDVFLALTSYPPGDGASEAELEAFRVRIADAFNRGGGVLPVRKEQSLFVSTK